MKKTNELLRKIGGVVLAAIVLTAQMPVTALAEEPAAVELETAVAADEDLPIGDREAGAEAAGEAGSEAAEKAVEETAADKESSDNEDSEEAEKSGDEGESSAEEEKDGDSEEKKYPAFSESKSIYGVRITVEAEEGVFPEGATLSVEKVTIAQEKQAEEAVESERDEDKQVAATYTYDIKVLDKDGNEIQPAGENGEDSSSRVKVSFKLDEVADENLTTNVYHIKEVNGEGAESKETSGETESVAEKSENAGNGELTAEKLEVETDGDTAIAETDGFSLYTVEFTYDSKQYVLPGDSEVALSEVLDTVDLTGEVSAVEVSDENLFSAKKCKTAEGGKTPVKDEDGEWVEDENGTWFVFAHKAFSTEEWMKVTIGGVVYEITVTDEVLTSVVYVDENGKEQTAENVDVVTTDMEGYEYKFVSSHYDGWLYVKNDVTLNGASNNASYPIKLILGDNATLTINGYLGIAYVDLTIYCQSGGTGKLVINANCISNSALFIQNSRTLTINGGTVEVKNSHVSGNGFGGNLVMNGGTASFEGGGYGIETGGTQTVAFNGGSLTAVGGGWGISDGTVTLDYKNSTDQIKVSSYPTYSSLTVTIADGKYFKDDDGNLYSGTLTKEQKTAIAGKTLKPAIFHDISVDSSITGGTITAATTIAPDASSATGGQTVTLTAAPDEGYELDTVTVTKNGGGTVSTSGTGNTRTFTMPEEATTVSATFTLAPKTGSCGASASDHVTYTLTDTDKDNKYDKLEIAGTGAMADFQADGSNMPWYDHRKNIKILTIAEGVTRIGTGAFRNIAGITSVNIPASVTGIGDNAFVFTEGKNTALTTVSFASGSQCRSIGEAAFQNRCGLANITLPAELESIGDKAFYENTALTSIDIPSKVTSIGDSVFDMCTNLATVRILGSPATIGSRAFHVGTITPNDLTVYASAVNKTDALESLYESSTGSPRNLVYICTAPEAPETSSFTYNGAEKTVAIAAPANCGYTVTGDKQTNVGSYIATATLNTGESEEINFPSITITKQYVWGDASTLTPAASGETDAKTYAWSITPKSISDVTVAAIPDQTYTGTAIEPVVTVKDGTRTLTLDTDYTVEYSNNINAASKDDATAPTVTIKGKGNYADTSTLTVKFTIQPKPVAVSGITAEDKVYDGTTAATLNYTGATFIGVIGGDNLTVTATGNFTVANAGDNKTVNITDFILGGSSASNYVIAAGSQTTTTATISKADIQGGDINAPAAKTGLAYTESAQGLVTAGSVSGNIGTMQYTLGTDVECPVDFTPAIPSATNAGIYHVWYKVKGDDNHNDTAVSGPLTVDIAKAHFTNITASGNTKYGLSGTIELKEHIASGGTVGALSVVDTNEVLEGTPVLTGTVLSYSFKSVSENVGNAATVTIPVTNATNYKDYSITATLNVINCEHPHTELRNIKEATCTEKGCKGDLYCTECNSLLLKGEEIPINPDNHAFVLASVVSSPDSMTGEIRTYRCSRCGKTYTDPLITSPKTDENGNTTESVAVGGVTVEEVTVDKTTGKETVSTRVWVSGLNSSYTYTGSAIKPSFKVYSGTTLLKEGTDYSVSYKNNKNAGTAYVYIKFKGNYKDTKTETLSFSIAAATLGKEIIAHQVGVAEKKKAQKPVPVLTWADTGKSVSSRYFNISYSPATVKTAGEYTAAITPKSGSKNFTGSTTAKVVVTDKAKLLSSAKVTFSPKSYAYTGGEITPSYTLTLGGITLTEGRDYKRVNLCNNVKPGNATVIFEGMNGYYGSKTATFRISGRIELDNSSDFTYTYSSSVAYTKGGAKPAVSVKDNKNGVTLTEGTDYTLSYSKNKAVTNGAVIKVKGKGSYKGTVTLYFAITQQSLSALESNIHAADQFVVKKKLKKPTVTIYDLDGKKLSANRDFTIGAAGTPSGDEKSGTVTVTVYGIGAYTGQAAVTYRYMEKSGNISAARLRSKIADQEYTGNAVKLSYAELTNKLYISGSGTSKNLVPGTDFVIASYSSNIKKGTAKVTIRGTGAYAGTKTLSFKIVQRKVNYAGKLWN